jgi:hypothetical protein
MTGLAVQEIPREDSERVVAGLLNERERLVFHLCSLLAERDESAPDTHAMGRARAFLAEMGIVDVAALAGRGETGRMQ